MGQQHAAAYAAMGVPLVAYDDANIISIASPDSSHGLYAINALQAGKHVFCEKPLVTDRNELGQIVKLVGDRHIGQNYPLRYQAVFIGLKDHIDLGDLGEIYRIDATYKWGRSEKLKQTWRAADPNYSLVLGGMIHMIDAAFWLTEDGTRKISRVSACGTTISTPSMRKPSTVVAQCQADKGLIFSFTVDGGTGYSTHEHAMTVVGAKGNMTVINREATDKQAAIKEFVATVRSGAPPRLDFRAIDLALEIDQWV